MTHAWSQEDFRPHEPTFPFAVYWNEEEERNIPVYLPSDYADDIPASLREFGEVYNDDLHDGHLRCPDGCHAHLHVNWGSENRSPHFKTNPDSAHRKDCKYKPQKPLAAVLDMEAYRNPTERQFHHRSPRYISNRQAHLQTRTQYEDLRGRAKEHFATAADFVDLIARERFDRIKDMLLVDQHLKFEEREFFIRYSRNSTRTEFRFINLMKRLEDAPADNSLPCLMEFQVASGSKERASNEHKSVTSKSIFHFQEQGDNGYDGAKHFIVPRALPQPEGSNIAEQAFPVAGNYLVLGYASLPKPIIRDEAVIQYLDIDIRHAEQVAKADIMQIIADRKISRLHVPSSRPA